MSKNTRLIVISVLVIIGGLFLYYKSNPKYVLTPGPIVGSMSGNGQTYLTDKKGMTLYVYTDDNDLKGTCMGVCLNDWAVFEYDNQNLKMFSDTLSRNLNIITRTDKWMQYAYLRSPLYYYKGDTQMGDMKGAGMENGKWNIINLSE